MNNKHIIINNNIKDIESKYYLKQKIKNTVDIICNKKIKFCNNKLINDVKNKIIIDYVKNSISGKINEQLLSSYINKNNIIIKSNNDKNIYYFSDEMVKYLNLDTPYKTMNDIYISFKNKMISQNYDMFYCILLDRQLKILLRYNVNNKKIMTIEQIVDRIKLFHIIDNIENNDNILSYYCNKPNPHYMAFFTM